MFWIFGPETCGIWVPRLGIESALPTLNSKVLTTGPPGGPPSEPFKYNRICQ